MFLEYMSNSLKIATNYVIAKNTHFINNTFQEQITIQKAAIFVSKITLFACLYTFLVNLISVLLILSINQC